MSRGRDRVGVDTSEQRPIYIEEGHTSEIVNPEQELTYIVERGDWELLANSSAFRERSIEGQTQLFSETIDNRVAQLEKSLNDLTSRGEKYHAATIGVLNRLRQLRDIRDNLLKSVYEKNTHQLSSESGTKVDF